MIGAVLRWMLSRPVDPAPRPALGCDTCAHDFTAGGRRLCNGMAMGHITDEETRREARRVLERWRALFLRDGGVVDDAADCPAWRRR